MAALLLPPWGLCCRRCRGLLRAASSPSAAFPHRSFLLLAAPSAQAKLPAGLPPLRLPPPPLPPPSARPFSSDSGRQRQRKRAVVVVGVPNPLMWLRTRLYFFLIRAYFDQEFSIREFTEGAKQAFAHVSRLIAQCKYDLLEELVSKEGPSTQLYIQEYQGRKPHIICFELEYTAVWTQITQFKMVQILKEKLSSLSENHRSALAADVDEIMYTTAGDVGIYYDDNGRKFVSILMRFWYLTSADLPDETPDGTKVFQVVFGDEASKETKRLLTANYEFRREFTQGVKPDWIITRIEHPKLLE